MALKITAEGEMKKERKMPKYYEPKIQWVTITPELQATSRRNPLKRKDHSAIGKSIKYSAESIRKALLFKKDKNHIVKVNKIIWDAIVKYMDAKKSL